MEKFTSPSPEEERRAEERMTPSEKILTEERVLRREAIQATGHEGHLFLETHREAGDEVSTLEGIVDGHPIKIKAYGAINAIFSGELKPSEGEEAIALDPDEAKNLYLKFTKHQSFQSAERSELMYISPPTDKDCQEAMIQEAKKEREEPDKKIKKLRKDDIVRDLLDK